MSRTIGRLADRLLSSVVPQTTAMAEYEYRCNWSACTAPYGRLEWRYCSSGCSQWYYDSGNCQCKLVP